MLKTQSLSLALLVVMALALPGPSQAQVDRDSQEISSYVLTDAGLQRYAKANVALGTLAKKAQADCDDSDSDNNNSKSLDELVTHFNAMPGVKAALQSAGMTAREYLVFSMSIFQTGLASWGLSQPGGKLPPGVSMANVNFYRKNEAAMASIGTANESDDCNDERVKDGDGE